MRIISGFKDYYDSVQRDDEERTPVFVRNQVEEELRKYTYEGELKKLFGFVARSWSYYRLPYSCMFNVIGFCGKLYEVTIVWWSEKTFNKVENKMENKVVKKFCYSFEEFVEVTNKILQSHKKLGKRENADHVSRKRKANELFTKMDTISESFLNIFFELKTPCFLIQPKEVEVILTVCPKLEDWEFQKIFDTFSAYQEIRMFISGVLTNNEEVPQKISDEDMRDMKGFDDQSFKKTEHQSKPRKKRINKKNHGKYNR